MDFTVKITNKLYGLVDLAHENNDAGYVQAKKDLRTTAAMGKLGAVVLAVAAVALLALGIATMAAGPFVGAFIGFPIVLVSLAAFYASYNAYQVSTNLLEISDNPVGFMINKGNFDGPLIFDQKKLSAQLEKKTFCFELFVDKIVESVAQAQQQ